MGEFDNGPGFVETFTADLYNGVGGGKGILLGVLAADVVFGGAELLGAGVDAAGVVVDGASGVLK